MNIEQQVCSRPLAERMKELGFVQNAVYYYTNAKHNGEVWKISDEFQLLCSENGFPYCEYNTKKLQKEWADGLIMISAYTVSELGEFFANVHISRKDYLLAYFDVMDLDRHCFDLEEDFALMNLNLMTQPDIPAQMLIWMAEQNLINPKTIKL